MKVRDLLEWAQARLRDSAGSDPDSIQLDAQLLLSHALKQGRAWLFTWDDAEVSEPDQLLFQRLLERRAGGEPVAYILRRAGFWSLEFESGPEALIPRPETELLVELALDMELHSTASALDLGTGTGAIALALASERPHWQITAVDSSNKALALAARNLQRQGWLNVRLLLSDWFTALEPGAGFDLILANPPYVSGSSPCLDQGDVRFEPRSALVSGEQGLADITRILNGAVRFLKPGATLMIEHGFDQQSAVAEAFGYQGFQNLKCHYDLNGLPRVTQGSI